MARKETKPAERCETCDAITKSREESLACDVCGKLIAEEDPALRGQILHEDERPSEAPEFCSWKCTLAFFSKRRGDDYFAVLPYLHYDEPGPCSAEAFWEAVREFEKKGQ